MMKVDKNLIFNELSASKFSVYFNSKVKTCENSSREIKMTKVKSKSKSQVHSMWLCSAVAQKEEFKYGCWIRQIEAEFEVRQEILVKSRQPGRCIGNRKSHLLFCSCARSNFPGQRITCN